jgi:hypothetical protein
MVREGLRRFKQWAETGEIATIEGQPEGPRSPMGKIARYLDPNPARRQARTVAAEPRTGTF